MSDFSVTIGDVAVGNHLPFVLIAGPCQIESRGHALETAAALHEMAASAGVPLIYKSSFDKANRTSAGAARGVGLAQGLAILADIRERFGIPVLTDVHDVAHCAPAAEAVDVLQIPAFLCRQTDLLIAAGETGRAINVKKGQFLAPWDMVNVAAKIAATGNRNISTADRARRQFWLQHPGDRFSQHCRSWRATGYPVVFDATHSVQQPGGQGTSSGGQREFAPVLARAALAVGVAALFIEAHENPDAAPSDGPNMIALRDMPALIRQLKEFDKLSKAGLCPDPPKAMPVETALK